MNHYIDIRLRRDPEFPAPMLMGALYGKLHRALSDLDTDDIGVSFPEHKTGKQARTLGELLRLHSSASRLEQLMTTAWLMGMRDHVSISEVQEAPPEAHHQTVTRRQPKTNAERLRRRYARRHQVTLEEARAHIPDSVERRITLPFAQLASRSTGQRFSLFIEHGKPGPEPISGRFNHYGLSQEATVPCF